MHPPRYLSRLEMRRSRTAHPLGPDSRQLLVRCQQLNRLVQMPESRLYLGNASVEGLELRRQIGALLKQGMNRYRTNHMPKVATGWFQCQSAIFAFAP
jgi:hypothetical protein